MRLFFPWLSPMFSAIFPLPVYSLLAHDLYPRKTTPPYVHLNYPPTCIQYLLLPFLTIDLSNLGGGQKAPVIK